MLADPAAVVLQDTTGADVQQLLPTGPGDLVSQLNDAAGRRRLAVWVALAALVLAISLGAIGLLVLVLAIPLIVWLGLRDRARRSVVAFYEVDGSPAAWFEQLISGAADLGRVKRVWRIVASGAVSTTYQHKRNAGASAVVSRTPVKVTLSGPPRLVTNVEVPTINVGRMSLHFLPDRVLLREGRRFTDVDYGQLRVTAGPGRFIESGSVPSDAQQVATTWRQRQGRPGPSL